MTNKEFCRIVTQVEGEEIDNVKQLTYISFNGEELKEWLETSIEVMGCCTELKDKETLTFDDWCEKYVSVQGENIYLYNKTGYSLFELMIVYKKIKELNL